MSLLDRNRLRLAGLGLALSLAAAAGCTVQPLYGTGGTTASGAPMSAELATVAVAPVGDRVSQEVRNHLIFLLSGGAGEPSAARYTAQLAVSVSDAAAASVQVGRDEEPTASLVTVAASYTLTDDTGNRIGAGSRSAQAAYDVSRQQFAALRASRDAQNRAAREAAELVRLAIAQDISRRPTR
ncbi:LPS assembly lipoprotein LptE [Mesorhizobium sp. YIM 152430]|uniref:LPS assembly lipoprotein LptE n=1 Tax=Mesorhizobium sp. YIM 152430 TaxID=3031761 RepID=UPI0023DA30D9|nr:LPS assembly lipoprotein LptE [Mesorhizobium sp. YIM 152430]MDF1599382.1 LPS assembly lipoprotein LptE [Mesorhizobium sp. YIM 152430]